MTEAGCGRDDGHRGMLAHKVNQAPTASRDEEVYIVAGMEQGGSGLVVGRQEGDHIGVQALALEHLTDESHDGQVGAMGIATSLQHTGIATLQAEGRDIEADIGTGFVDDANHAKGHTDAAQAQSVGQLLLLEHPAQGRRQRGYMAGVVGNGLQAGGGKLQAVVLGIVGRHAVEVFLVFGQQLVGLQENLVGDLIEYLIDLGIPDLLQVEAGLPHGGKDFVVFHVEGS